MKFIINNDKWTIEEKTAEEMKNLYETQKYPDEDVFFVFGLTNKAEHQIYINKNMVKEQKIKTLKHELTHYGEIVEIAREFIQKQGGFEKFAKWGLF